MAIKITFFIISLCLAFVSHAHSPDSFWSENFANGIPTGWTSSDLSGNDMVWEHCDQFLKCPPLDTNFLLPLSWFESKSFEDGYAYLAPYNTIGTGGAHESVLTSSPVNCEGQEEVFLRFTTLMISGENQPEDNAVLQVKVGNEPWTEAEDFIIFRHFKNDVLEKGPNGFQSYNPHTVWLDLTDIAANQPDIRFRWVWKWDEAFVFFWAIDDIELFDSNPVHGKAVWGMNSGEGDFEGSLNEWSVISTGQCGWSWSENGLVDNPDADAIPDYYSNSPTAENGLAVVSTTACGLSYSELISPNIDLSALPLGKKLDLTFYQTGAFANRVSIYEPIGIVHFSLDGGASYSSSIEINSEQPFVKVFNGKMSLPIPDEAVGLNNFRFKFTFHGYGVFWAIDDVCLIERGTHNLAISPSYFSVANNYSTPVFAVSPMYFGADILNLGTGTQDFANLYVEVIQHSNMDVVFRDTLTIGTIEAGETIEELYFEKKFLPPNWKEKFTCRYRLEYDNEDEAPNDNKRYFQFEISDTVFSKTNGPASINAAFVPSAQLDYEIGNCFFVPPGAGLEAKGVNFAFDKNNGLLDGIKLTIALYKWKDDNSYGDANQDTIANHDEFSIVSFASFETEIHVDSNDPLNKIYFAPISDDVESVALEDSTYYFATVEYKHENIGVVFPIAGSEEINYTSTFLQSYEEGLPRYCSVLRLGSDDDFLVNSWGLQRIPYVELVVERKYTPAIEVEKNDVLFSVYPNPATDHLYLDFQDPEKIGAETRFEVYDINGQVQYVRELKSKNVSHTSIPISSMSNGTYILRVISGESSGSRLFTVLNE